MSISRRDFIKVGTAAASLAALPRPLRAAVAGGRTYVPGTFDPDARPLAMRALDAARSAGAAYADVRLTHSWLREVDPTGAYGGGVESMEAGARALVQGYWGFASGPVWSPEEMSRLGREAVRQAKANALGKTRVVDLAPAPAVAGGHWVMPVAIDPFEISPFEMQDHLRALQIFTANAKPGASIDRILFSFSKQEKAFASSEGSYCTQRLYLSAGDVQLVLKRHGRKVTRDLDELLTPATVGWEMYHGKPVRETILRLLDEMDADLRLPVKPVDVGRYDAVIDVEGVSELLDETLGRATELDRALGYEANAGGTSYIDEPFAMLGSYHAGTPSLTITANRAEPGGCATVKWDDEGVAPDDFTLVKDGVLTDFQTTRESAGWLKDYYAKTGKPVRSHGCATAGSAIDAPLQRTPNLAMRPGREALDFDALLAGIGNGIAIADLDLEMDFQHLNGLGTGRIYEVKRGKKVALVDGGGVLFRAPELWKGLHALGGPASARRFGSFDRKGEPSQRVAHSVTAVPAVFKQLTLIDPERKA